MLRRVLVRVACMASALAVTFLATGCSLRKFAYDHADWLLYDRINSFFCISGSQKSWVRSEIKRIHRWHRLEQLPVYASLLEDLGSAIELQDEDRLEVLIAQARFLYQDTQLKLLPQAVHFLSNLNGQQISCLEKRLRKNHQERLQEWKAQDAEERQQQAWKIWQERIEMFSGPLADSQVIKMKALVAPGGRDGEVSPWLARRYRAHSAFVDLLKTHALQPDFAAHLSMVVLEPVRLYAKEDRKHWYARRGRLADQLKGVVRLWTDEQRTRAMENLRRWAMDFRRWAQDGV